ncbi:hypothetical protein AB6H00_20680 [Providencia hangzhouensis]
MIHHPDLAMSIFSGIFNIGIGAGCQVTKLLFIWDDSNWLYWWCDWSDSLCFMCLSIQAL